MSRIVIDKLGEGDGIYTVGDVIDAVFRSVNGHRTGSITGPIREITIDHENGIYQLIVNHWGVHPSHKYGNDDVVIIEKYKSEPETKKEKLKKLTNEVLKGAYEAMLAQVDKCIESGALDIDSWDPDKDGFMLLPKIITVALMDIERDQYTARGTSHDRFVRKQISNLKYYL